MKLGINTGARGTMGTRKAYMTVAQLAERIGFEIQKLADGRSMVFIPSVPNAFSGITQILPADQVTYLDAPLTQIMEFVERYGHGVDGLLATKVIEPAVAEVDVGEDEAPDE